MFGEGVFSLVQAISRVLAAALHPSSFSCLPLFAPRESGQAQALGLQARVFISELFTKQAHRVSCPPKKPMAKSATLSGALEYVFRTVIGPTT